MVHLKLGLEYKTDHLEVQQHRLIFQNVKSKCYHKFDFPSSVASRLLKDFRGFYRVGVIKSSPLGLRNGWHTFQQLKMENMEGWILKLDLKSSHCIDDLKEIVMNDKKGQEFCGNNPDVYEMLSIYTLSVFLDENKTDK